MDHKSERKLLISEIQSLEEQVVATKLTNIDSVSDPEFFETFSTPKLRAMKQRFVNLLKSLPSSLH